ncbi:MAG: hypothetical protein U5J63_15465 [Fodinibius sp.]|nr:hypothetical protein [Fodinibius sp.]
MRISRVAVIARLGYNIAWFYMVTFFDLYFPYVFISDTPIVIVSKENKSPFEITVHNGGVVDLLGY